MGDEHAAIALPGSASDKPARARGGPIDYVRERPTWLTCIRRTPAQGVVPVVFGEGAVKGRVEQSQVLEPVPDELTRSFAGQAVAPVAAQDPVPEFGLPFDRALVRALRRLEDPPADELVIDEADPEAKSRHPPRGRETTAVEPLDLLASTRSTVAQIAHHLRIRVEVDLPLEVRVRQRDEPDATRVKRRLAHGPILAHP